MFQQGSSRRESLGVGLGCHGVVQVLLEKLPIAEMQAIEPRITTDVYGVLGARQSVKSRTSYGGTAPENVRREARRWLKRLAKEAAAKAAT